MGTKRHVLADKKGVPLSIVITSANTHDMKATAETLDCIVTKRPLPLPKKNKHRQQNLCLDKGYKQLSRDRTGSSQERICTAYPSER
jgi:putative transposase